MEQDKKLSRLEEEILSFSELSIEDLQLKRSEFANVRLIIQNEIQRYVDEEKSDKEWLRRANAAFRINGFKINHIDILISERNGRKKYFRKFFEVAKKNLGEQIFKQLQEEATRSYKNDKNL